MITGNFEKYGRSGCKKVSEIFTEIETVKIDDMCAKEKNINNLKVLLANEATTLLHGKSASVKAEKTAKETFQGGGLGSDLPEIKIKLNNVEKGINILNFIAENNILSSKSEARRVISNNGIKINDVVVLDEKMIRLNDFKKKKNSHTVRRNII